MVQPADVVKEALRHQGYIENPGKDNIFGKWFGANHTHWCAMFVSYCFNKAGAGKLVNGVQHKKGFYSCTAAIKVFRKRGQVIATKDAQPGDIIFFDWEHDNDPDHVGIVVSNNPSKKTMVTMEGNTTDPKFKGNQSNGGHAVKRTRYYQNVYCVVRPKWEDVAEHNVPVPVEKAVPVLKATPDVTIPTAVYTTPVSAPTASVASTTITTKPTGAIKPKPNSVYHEVVKGDTYWDLGNKYHVDYKSIQKLNGNSRLRVGMKLRIK